MRVLLALTATLAAVAAFAGPRAEDAIACSCAGIVPTRDLPRFDAAFVGRALSHRVDSAFVLWSFDIEQPVKGALSDPLVVRAPLGGGAACGLEIEADQRVGLLLLRDDTTYESLLCYKADPDALVRVALPSARVVGRPNGGDGWVWWAVAAGAGAVAATALAVFALRRRA